jgi:nitrile hydratase
MPFYLRGKRGTVEAVLDPVSVDNDEGGYGQSTGSNLHHYRVAIPMTEIWPDYVGSPRDGLRIEIVEAWLARI